MDWQTIFFAVATIFMIFMLGLFIALSIFLYIVARKVLFVTRTAEKSVKMAAVIGEGIADTVAVKVKQFMTPKKTSYR